MIFTLLLTIAGATTSHNVSALSYSRAQFTYTEGQLFICSGVAGFRFDATGAAVTAGRCVSDRIFADGFEK